MFNPLGAALADAYRKAMPDLSFETIPSSGAPRNLESLQRGEADVGFANADFAYLSYVGHANQTPPFDRIRAIAVLLPTVVHVIVPPGSPVRTLEQLAGRSVAVGPFGSGTALTAQVLLEAFGVRSADVKARYLPYSDVAAAVARGDVDAAVVITGYPSESVMEATSRGARLLEVAGPIVDRMRTQYPFFKVALLPSRAYPGLGHPVHTVSIDALMVCSASLDDVLVYRLTRVFFEVLPELAREVDALRGMDVAQAAATPIPLHDGAARYYRERELLR